MREILIRRACAADLPQMQKIAKRTIDHCYRPFLGDKGVDWFIHSGESDRELTKHIRHCDLIQAVNKITGFAIYFDDLIHLMMVDVNQHRTGIGSRLLAHTETQLLARGNAILRLSTFAGNHQAINFYLKNGWSEAGREKDVAHGFDRVFFERMVFDDGETVR